MNRVNPLHIILLLIVVLFFAFFKLAGIKSELKELQQEYKKSQKVAEELVSYKKLYGNRKRVQKALQKIVSQRSLKSANIKLLQRPNSLEIKSASIKLNELNSLISKVLNGSYEIKRLKIKSLDATHASVAVEIAW